MSKIVDEVIGANQKYAREFGAKGELALPPARQFAILTCMDARLDPAKYAGLAEGDAHVIRNAGGRATDDAIRSLVISHKLLGTREWLVIHHTNCGMEGGFKWSSQHLDWSCDEHSKTALGSFWAGAVVLTRSTAGGRARGAAAILGSDCGRRGE